MSKTQQDSREHNQLQVQSLIYVLTLGGLVGCLDPIMETGAGVRAAIAFWSGVGLLLLVPIVWYTKDVQRVMACGIAIAWSCFFSCFLLSGDHFYLAQGTSVPIAAAMFLRFRHAVSFFAVHAVCAIVAASLIQFEIWDPPFLPHELGREIIGEAVAVALVAAALTIPAAWKERRSRQAIANESTARKDAEIERRRFENVVSSSYGAIVEADEHGRIYFAEGPLLKKFGYRPEDLVGKHQLSFIPKSDRKTWVRSARSNEGFSREFLLKGATGELSWVAGSVAIPNDDESVRFVTAIRDIQQEVLSREQLQNMARLEGLATVCAGLSHDFNNLLTVFGVLFEFIEDDGLRADLLQAHDQATSLTQGLLSFASRRESVNQPTLVGSFVEEMEPIVSRISGATVACRWNVTCPDASVLIEYAKLQQLVINLVTNARHAMPDGGVLTLRLEEVKVDEMDLTAFPAYDLNAGSYVRVEITDTGAGMDEITQARAVEPFFTTKPRGVGTGLGLSTTHGSVVAVGGAMRIDSRLGAGTTITILLPLEAQTAVDDAASATEMERTETQEREHGFRIALVDDREILAESMVAMLRRLGHFPSAFYSAEEMLAAEDLEDFQLLITDLELPGMDGLELAEHLAVLHPSMRPILMSGHPQTSESIPDSMEFLPKPFTLARLVQVIDATLAKRPATI